MHLILATVWLIVAALFFYGSWTQPDNPYMQIFGTGYSIGWLALLMSGYNLVRWYAKRDYQKHRQQPYTNPLLEKRNHDNQRDEDFWQTNEEKGLHD